MVYGWAGGVLTHFIFAFFETPFEDSLTWDGFFQSNSKIFKKKD